MVEPKVSSRSRSLRAWRMKLAAPAVFIATLGLCASAQAQPVPAPTATASSTGAPANPNGNGAQVTGVPRGGFHQWGRSNRRADGAARSDASAGDSERRRTRRRARSGCSAASAGHAPRASRTAGDCRRRPFSDRRHGRRARDRGSGERRTSGSESERCADRHPSSEPGARSVGEPDAAGDTRVGDEHLFDRDRRLHRRGRARSRNSHRRDGDGARATAEPTGDDGPQALSRRVATSRARSSSPSRASSPSLAASSCSDGSRIRSRSPWRRSSASGTRPARSR